MSTTPTAVHHSQIAARRTAPHVSMFFRMLIRAAAAVATAMMNLYVDVQAKLRTEFRNYGANVVVVAKGGGPLPADALGKIESDLGVKTLAVPFSYAVARTTDGQSVIVVGTDFNRVRHLNHWWNVSRWPSPPRTSSTAPIEALVGMRAAAVVTPDRKPFDLSFQGRSIHLNPAGLLQTGAGEDSRIYLDQTEFQNWTGVSPTTIEIAINGSSADIEKQIAQLAQALPGTEVRPVRQIMEGEANVLNKTRATLYAAAALIIVTSALCVLATLTGLIGFGIGIGVAAWIGRANFHAPVVPRFSVFPYVLAGSILVALISALLPIGLLRRVQPALILRGE